MQISSLFHYITVILVITINSTCSIYIGYISNATFLASNISQTYSNITCQQCTCNGLMSSAVGWIYIARNQTCQLINGYSSNDIGLVPLINAIFYFQPLLAPTTTTTTFNAIAAMIEGGQRRIGNVKPGDRVWTLSYDGQYLIEDEITIIVHAELNTPTYFYTFITNEGHEVSLTDLHYIVIFDSSINKMDTICASQVTLHHRLVMLGRTIAIEKIIYSKRIGFSSPVTLSGYLLVNNLSTSSFHGTHDFHHRMGDLPRFYYRITKWLFGNNYKPFGSTISEEMHPLCTFVITIYEPIRLFTHMLSFMILPLIIILAIYLIALIFYKIELYYLKIIS
ncbi:unnamed protein product [Adineta steineri]|uniref:Hedgehog protein Hint domain-containing protein n=1 Tax=Adineta steineri TaxID=433720 RepID=A0A813VLM7_9BILA|nr:unnamed protein product [Adineta steineri]CAF1124264.1 unnamed protein product [Adineta steineri]